MGERVRDIRPPWMLSCRALSVRRGGRLVLRDVDLSIRDGECVSLIGPNGSGKTTLMLALLGLLPPSAGQVTINDLPLRRLSARARGRFASYVPQVVERIPAFSIFDVVAAARYPHVAALRPLSRRDHDAVERALQQCGLEELAQRPINAVSAGERQKVLIAAAIAQDAQVMLLDEPNTALDPAYQVELARLLRGWRQRRRALVLISHELQLPAVLGGRVVALRGGRVVADGDAEDVLQPERLRETYATSFETVISASGQRFVLPRWSEEPAGAT